MHKCYGEKIVTMIKQFANALHQINTKTGKITQMGKLIDYKVVMFSYARNQYKLVPTNSPYPAVTGWGLQTHKNI